MTADPSTTAPLDLEACLRVAIRVAEEAGQVAVRYFRGVLDVRDKGGTAAGRFNPVTQADEEVEQVLRRAITASFPHHAIMGEEAGGTLDAPIVWVLDPIDGTKSFVAGSPLWGILVGVVVDGHPVLGVMHQPVLGETFVGTGERAWVRTSDGVMPLATSGTVEVDEAIIGCTDPDVFRAGGHAEVFDSLVRRSRFVRYGGDCYSYCLMALGRMDAVVERGLQPYDILPLVPIVTGAGGVIGSPDGGIGDGGTVIAAANARLHRRLVGALSVHEATQSMRGA